MLVVSIIIISLYDTPAVRQAVLRLAWYIRLIRFDIRFEREKKRLAGPYIVKIALPKAKIKWSSPICYSTGWLKNFAHFVLYTL